MYGARTLTSKKRPVIIFDKRFKELNLLQVGDKGQCILNTIVTGIRQETSEDGTDYIVRTFEIRKVELVNDKTKL